MRIPFYALVHSARRMSRLIVLHSDTAAGLEMRNTDFAGHFCVVTVDPRYSEVLGTVQRLRYKRYFVTSGIIFSLCNAVRDHETLRINRDFGTSGFVITRLTCI